MLKVAVLVALVLLTACSTSPTAATMPSGERLTSPSPSASGSPVAPEVLAPATVLPVAALCSQPIYETADGNFEPRFCGHGALNVLAWGAYAPLTPHVFSLGRQANSATLVQAVHADGQYRATRQEMLSALELATAYYGWTFTPDPTCWPWTDDLHPKC